MITDVLQRKYYSLLEKSIGLRIKDYINNRKYFRSKKGLEIGGPSNVFTKKSILPIYSDAVLVDGVNFSTQTVWENEILPGKTYKYTENKIGHQYISEASNLKEIKDNSYDFLISSHCLEHCANAISTVKEWLRVIKPGGAILIIVPNKESTFDHKRPITKFDHLLDDFKSSIGEDDLSHMKEILALHDLSKDPGGSDLEIFKERSLNNKINRCFHHHIFDFKLLEEIFTFLGIKIIFKTKHYPCHLIIMGEKI